MQTGFYPVPSGFPGLTGRLWAAGFGGLDCRVHRTHSCHKSGCTAAWHLAQAQGSGPTDVFLTKQ